MRGEAPKQSSMLCLISPEQVVPTDHPLRSIRKLADEALAELSPTFDHMYSGVGRPSVQPERLLKALLLVALYSVRSEQQLCEPLQYNMLFRWFLDMDMVEAVFDASTFSQNRDRLLEHDVAREFLQTPAADRGRGREPDARHAAPHRRRPQRSAGPAARAREVGQRHGDNLEVGDAPRANPLPPQPTTAAETRRKVGREVALRRKVALTQLQLAGRMGVVVQLIQRIEGGKQNLTIDSLVRLANALGVPVERLFAADANVTDRG